MKRLLIGAAGALAIAAAAGWGLWRWGASEIEARMDAEVAGMAADGVSLSWRERRVGGFPMGYVVRLEDVGLRVAESDDTLQADWVEMRADLGRAGEAVFTAASPILATIGGTEGEAPRRLSASSENLAVAMPLDGDGPRRLTADALTLSSGQASGSIMLEGVALAVAAAGEGATVQGTVAAIRTQTGGEPMPTRTEARDIELSARALGAGNGVAGLIAEGGVVEATLTIGASSGEAAGLRSEGGPARTRVRLAAGRLEVEGEADSARYDIALPGEDGVGRVEVARTSLSISTPLLRSDAPQAFSAALTIDGAEPDEAIWRAVDPAETLPREPFALRLDLVGAARLTADLTAAAESPTQPIALETLEIRAAEARGGGLTARAAGAMTLGGAAGAQGRFDVDLSGWAPILAALVDLGVVGPDQAALLALTIERYNAPDAAEGDFVAEVVLDGQTAFINGAPLR